MTQRELVAEKAREWIGTPYHHRARVLGHGVDCAQLPAAVYHSAGIIPLLSMDYATDWHLHHSEELYIDGVVRWAHEIEPEQAGLGDLIIWKFGRTFSHGGIVADRDVRSVIHAKIDLGVELSSIITDEELRVRPRRYFSVWSTVDGR